MILFLGVAQMGRISCALPRMTDVRVRIRFPVGFTEPRVFEATVTDDNRWTVHIDDRSRAQELAQGFRDAARRGEHRSAAYAPEPAYRWADVVVALFVGSEVLTSRDRISDRGVPLRHVDRSRVRHGDRLYKNGPPVKGRPVGPQRLPPGNAVLHQPGIFTTARSRRQ